MQAAVRSSRGIGMWGTGSFAKKASRPSSSPCFKISSRCSAVMVSLVIDGLFGLGANLFFHFVVMFELFEDELVLLVGDVRILDSFADDSRYIGSLDSARILILS